MNEADAIPETLPPVPALDLAALLVSGVMGAELEAHLQERFATISRAEVFTALRFASAVWPVDLHEARLERDKIQLELDAALIELAWLRRQVGRQRDAGAWLKPDAQMQEAA